jgi:hypothetical protein
VADDLRRPFSLAGSFMVPPVEMSGQFNYSTYLAFDNISPSAFEWAPVGAKVTIVDQPSDV